MYEEYSWREKRLNMHSIGPYPYFIETGLTTVPQGNAHYSMYGITKGSAKAYQKLFTKMHVIYEHYSSEIIIDAETERAVDAVLGTCHEKNWSYLAYNTGSGSRGAHIHIPREAEPSEHLYLRDRMFIEEHFEGVPDIDTGVLFPMHLIRGIGKVHEETGKVKYLHSTNEGTVIPSVVGITVYQLLLDRHNRIRQDYKQSIYSDWTKLQNTLLRHNPSGITAGKRHVACFCISRDLFKCGLDLHTVKSVVAKFAAHFAEPYDDSEAADNIENACNGAFKSFNRG